MVSGPTVKGGVSGIEQGPGFVITARCKFLVGEKHQKIGIVIRMLTGSLSNSCPAKTLGDDRGCQGG
jgi:hypothetical protein